MKLNSFYSLAIEAAVEAGKAIIKVYNSNNYEIEIKPDDSPVTRADRDSSAVIAQYLKQTSFPVIDEEHGCPDFSIRKSWRNHWLVDPLDGTKEFISGNGEFTVNIALIEGQKSVFGVIYAPVTGDLYWGGRDTGSYKLERIKSWPGLNAIENAPQLQHCGEISNGVLRVAASRSHLDKGTGIYLDKLRNHYKNIELQSGGSSLKLCMIAEGCVDVYPRFSRTMEWDTAAGHAIVSGTSGILLQTENLNELLYNKKDLSNPPFVAISGSRKKDGIEEIISML